MSETSASRRVQLFGTCLVETLRPEAGMAVVRVLERLGVTVEYPEGQTCCGQPAFNAGGWDDARAMGRYTLDVLSKSPAPIVVPSGSCADMLVHHYPELFAGDAKYGPLAEDIAGRTYEFSQYLVDVLGYAPQKEDGAESPSSATSQNSPRTTVTYHPSCHLLRGLKITEPPRRLLESVSGVNLVDLPGADECCGFGGLFAIKLSDISSAMLERKLKGIEATGAEIVVGCDISCLLHIGGGLHRQGKQVETRHLAEMLDQTDQAICYTTVGER